ncbi:MAG: DNA mismatch repair protein MutS [Nitrospirae bacterium]|nr:DNA mismatch repair protein MutS [Nitrospirota bacterium]
MDGFTYRPFSVLEGLKKRLSEKPLSEKLPPAKDDEELFREAMSRVKEIKEFRSIPYEPPRRKTGPKATQRKDESSSIQSHLLDIVTGKAPIDIENTPEYVQWVNPTGRAEFLSLLQRGAFSVQDYIDLHGYTVVEAREALEAFIREARRKTLRCIKIIHGRGLRSVRGPVLKRAVCQWLERDFRKYVIAYTTARKQDGGLGAVYVLLRL